MAGYDTREGKIWMDGKLTEWGDANIHILTHALHYASSVFEGERAYNGKIFKSREHSERLHFSAGQLDFRIPYTVDELEAAKQEVLAANGLADAYVRAIAWRGVGEDMGVASRRNPVRVAVAAWEWGNYYGDAKTRGAKLDIAKWKRPSPETIPSHAKAAGLYMICTMNKHEVEAAGYDDALMLDYRGFAVEGTGANLFMVVDGKLHTPKPDCFLNGITRQTVMSLADKRQIPIVERHITPEELMKAEEVFVTGTAAEVTPVGSIDGHSFTVGRITRTLMDDYTDLVRNPARQKAA